MQTRILTQFKSDCQKLAENNNATDKQLQIPLTNKLLHCPYELNKYVHGRFVK